VEDIVKRLEKGDLNLRVRTLEVERELELSKLAKKNTFEAELSGLLFQAAIAVATVGGGGVYGSAIGGGLFGAANILGVRVLRKLDKYNELYGVGKQLCLHKAIEK
jgi:hypothetical protein